MKHSGSAAHRGSEAMKIRPMTESDHAAVSHLLCNCYRLLGRLEELRPEAVDYLLSKRGSVESIEREAVSQTFLVAEADGRITGMVAIHTNTISKLHVDPSCHARGIGRALFGEAEALIRRSGYKHLTLGSSPSAEGFYKTMGMSATGVKHLKRGPLSGHSVVLMHKHLAPL